MDMRYAHLLGWRFLKRAFTLLLCLLFISGCGGGGGGSSSGGSGTSGISYSGATNQASLSNTNAQSISTSAYQGGSPGSLMAALVQNPDNEKDGHPRHLILAQALKKALSQINADAGQGALSKATTTKTGTFGSDCTGSPGSLSYTLTYDDVTGNFLGSLSFSSYCKDGVIFSGSAAFSGQLNTAAAGFKQVTISTDSLSVVSGSDSYTMDFDISYNMMVTPAAVTINLLMKDDGTSKVFRIENMNMLDDVNGSYTDINVVSGVFYHPDYGYVDCATTTPLRIYDGSNWPSQGVLIITGASSSARMTVISSTQYRIEADTDGDGLYDDYDSGTLLWASL